MHHDFPEIIRKAAGARSTEPIETIQKLWSGYGAIVRYALDGAARRSVVVKHVRFPDAARHPRGWDGDRSHLRKLRSYEVETAWYAHWSKRCDAACRVPRCLALARRGDETLMVLEDLDEAGFPVRRDRVGMAELASGLRWLARFHAAFMGEAPEGLWEQGTYWHLATRPDELAALDDLPLKRAAAAIDARLRQSRFRTVVHGDAKLANFCFSRDGKEVAAVDFQYAGGGCGMQDVAYFVGSCLDEGACAELEGDLLSTYFAALRAALAGRRPEIDPAAVETDWRPLYPVAWTDFHRFLKGWNPGHWKIHGYSERMARQVLAALAAC